MSPKALRDKVLRREAVPLDAPAAPFRSRGVGVRLLQIEKKMRGEDHMPHRHINPVQWQQAMGYARQACARIFRDGGSPGDAVRAFGLAMCEPTTDWSTAVDRVAHALCAPALRKAA
jgi:hypothetical protein